MPRNKPDLYSENFDAVIVENPTEGLPLNITFCNSSAAVAFAKMLTKVARKLGKKEGMVAIWAHDGELKQSDCLHVVATWDNADELVRDPKSQSG